MLRFNPKTKQDTTADTKVAVAAASSVCRRYSLAESSNQLLYWSVQRRISYSNSMRVTRDTYAKLQLIIIYTRDNV